MVAAIQVREALEISWAPRVLPVQQVVDFALSGAAGGDCGGVGGARRGDGGFAGGDEGFLLVNGGLEGFDPGVACEVVEVAGGGEEAGLERVD